jgi:PAS domain S-box-containing protein
MNSERIKVLFVDDEEVNLKAFRAAFRREMDVFTAGGGEEGLAILEQGTVHVVISDQRMPGMSGSEFLALVRARHPRCMRMLLTGYADLEAVVAAVNQGGIYAYATKPWDENDLRLRIQQAFEIHQLKHEKERLLDQYRQIFEGSGDPIALVDGRGAILEANRACERVMGLERAELMRTGFAAYIEDPRRLVHALRGQRNGNTFTNVDLTIRTPAGKVLDCLLTATYLGHQPMGRNVFQAIIKDVSDRRQEEERLRKLNQDLDRRVTARTAQLMEALEDLGAYSYSVAHDLRSPLKNMAAMSELLHGHCSQQHDEEALAFTERIQKGAQRLIGLVDDMLRFSQTNSRELDRREVTVSILVQEVIDEVVPEDRRGHLHVRAGSGDTILADAPLLKVALHNLLSNALKFTRQREFPSIMVELLREDGRDVLVVRDNGVGFDPQHKERVFGAFQRLHQPDQFEGTGIGLAIVSRIMRKHGGTAWAESAVDQGSSLYLAFPRNAAPSAAIPFIKVA